MNRETFYENQIKKFIKDKKSKILVLGAGSLDINLFKKLEYVNVTFSNIKSTNEKNLNIYENIHDIKIDDSSYDYCVAHACIHHSSKPHLAVLELYRVCAKGALIIEARDSILSRLACNFKISEEYELSAVKKNKSFGGVDNSNIPNYVFRWTEREVSKLMKSYKPEIDHKIYYDYGFNIKFTKSIFINLIFKLFFFIFKKQQNLFSFFINKENCKLRQN